MRDVPGAATASQNRKKLVLELRWLTTRNRIELPPRVAPHICGFSRRDDLSRLAAQIRVEIRKELLVASPYRSLPSHNISIRRKKGDFIAVAVEYAFDVLRVVALDDPAQRRSDS